MRINYAATWEKWRTKLADTTLVLLSLSAIGLQKCQAQLEYNGGFVQTHREDGGEAPRLSAPQRGVRSPVNTPPAYFPDNDYYYPSYFPRRVSELRYSSYYAAEGSGSALSSLQRRPPFGVSTASLPWNWVGFKDYDASQGAIGGSSRFYSLAATPLLQASPAERPETAVLIAHLPEHAAFWVEGTRTRSTGRTRYFQSPPLRPGREYNYQMRAAWIENGQWVSQTRTVLVQAGAIQTIYLRSK